MPGEAHIESSLAGTEQNNLNERKELKSAKQQCRKKVRKQHWNLLSCCCCSSNDTGGAAWPLGVPAGIAGPRERKCGMMAAIGSCTGKEVFLLGRNPKGEGKGKVTPPQREL